MFPRARPIHVPDRDESADRPRHLTSLLDRLRDSAIDRIIVVPLHEDDDFAVAKVVVPGLELPAGARAVPHGPRLRRIAESQP